MPSIIARSLMCSDASILVFDEWENRLETVEEATGDGVFSQETAANARKSSSWRSPLFCPCNSSTNRVCSLKRLVLLQNYSLPIFNTTSFMNHISFSQFNALFPSLVQRTHRIHSRKYNVQIGRPECRNAGMPPFSTANSRGAVQRSGTSPCVQIALPFYGNM